jgi:hypothetical protein
MPQLPSSTPNSHATGLVLGFYRDAEAARQARQKLHAAGFSRTALIAKADPEATAGKYLEARREQS